MHIPTSSHRRGFTLVELSIVLVIIGLIVGGTLVGSDLIHAAELRKTVSEYTEYTGAITNFKTRYNGLPGDLKDATNYWGEANADATACKTADSSTSQKTCDGDGDGTIGPYNSATEAYERYRFWQQLANAEMISGTFSGVQGSGGVDHVEVGINAPASKFDGAGWSMYYLDRSYSGGLWFDGSYSNALVLGSQDPNGTSVNAYPVLTPEDAYNIDSKIDDGRPAKGNVTARYSSPGDTCHNATSKSDDSAEYNLDSSDIGCVLLFKSGT